MPVQTHIDRARTRVRTEREAVDAKLDAIDAFVDRIGDLPTESIPSATTETITTRGGLVRVESANEDRCRTVRTVFAETIRPHSVADVDDSEPLLETVRSQLSDGIAVALAPTTDTSFTAELKQAILSAAATLRAETDVLRQALVREDARLDTAGETVDEITAWIAEADETPLIDLGFEALQQRHETLARHRDRCAQLTEQRQAFLQETTNEGVDIGIRHQRLIPYLYQEFPVDHPLLATFVQLDDACATCQRAVRQHLIRRA
jgi:hypothetical protein